MDALFSPLKFGALMAEYYAQRASAGLIIAEASMPMEGDAAFWKEPRIYSSGPEGYADYSVSSPDDGVSILAV